MKNTKVFAWFSFGGIGDGDEAILFEKLRDRMVKANVIVKEEEGSHRPWDSEPIGYSFTGDELVIRGILTEMWFPDLVEDTEWADIEKEGTYRLDYLIESPDNEETHHGEQLLDLITLINSGFKVSKSDFFHHSSSYQSVNVTGDIDKMIKSLTLYNSSRSSQEVREDFVEV